MPPYPCHSQLLRLDLKLLTKLIYELNIARHHTVTYPAGHPVIIQAIDRALLYLRQLQPEGGALALGIVKHKLTIGRNVLQEQNPVFREFASHYFSHGVALIALQQHLDASQLRSFLEITGQKMEDVHARGGLLHLIREAGIEAIRIELIDYSAFGISDQISDNPLSQAANQKKEIAIWERFVQNLLAGNRLDAHALPSFDQGAAPQAVAAHLNDNLPAEADDSHQGYDRAITEFLRELDREQMADLSDSLAISRLKGLASQLNPNLRAQLLNSTFRALAPREKMAERVLAQFPGAVLMEALETLNARQATIPPIIFTLLDRLTQSQAGDRPGSEPTAAATTADTTPLEPEQLLGPLLETDRSESFIPAEYGDTLQQIEAPAGPSSAATGEAAFWKSSFFEQHLESKVSDIVFELAGSGCDEGKPETLKTTLRDSCRLLLDTGDFAALGDIYSRLQPPVHRSTRQQPLWFRELLAELETPQHIGHILDALQVWGKTAFAEVAQLLGRIGRPAVGPLLDRLATETNRALRQFYMNCLVAQGASITEEVVARLQDDRWYYLRNLVIILRRLENPSLVKALDPLWHHPHERVRQEVLKTALIFRAPKGSAYLLEEMTQSDSQRRLAAAQMARYSDDPRIKTQLLAFFASRDLSMAGLNLKIAALNSLAEQSASELLPHLARQFRAFSLWHPRRQMLLRRRILRSLRHFPQRQAAALLADLSRIRRPKLARLVRQARANLLKEAP